MSYDLVKNLKIVKTDNGFNVACNIASSNIRTYDNKHVYEYVTRLFKNDFDTKESIEYKLFELFLDGELQGACGKFAPLNWNNNKIELSNKENRLLRLLGDKAYNSELPIKTRAKYEQKYNKIRYALYYRAWQNYLKAQKETKFIVKYNYNNEVRYVTKLTNRHIWANEDINKAQIFKGLPNKNVKDLLEYMNGYSIQYLNC